MRRGKQGPSMCILCRNCDESINHLFFQCEFSLGVWKAICTNLKIVDECPVLDFESAYQLWIQKHRRSLNVPAILAWIIWKTRNSAIFQDITPLKQTLFSFWNLYHTYSKDVIITRNHQRLSNLNLEENGKVVGFFDGASSENNCGARFTISCGKEYTLKFRLACGPGTNTKAELLGLWGFLKVALLCGMDSLRIFGDSLVIIKWANKLVHLDNVLLHHWCLRISGMLNRFLDLSIEHTYRENNDVADSLSKEALDGDPGILQWEEWVDEQMVLSGSMSSFFSEMF